MNVVPRCSQLSEESLKWAVTSSVELLSVVKLAEPKVLAAGSGFGLWPRNLRVADQPNHHDQPMMVEAEPGQVAVPMDSH